MIKLLIPALLPSWKFFDVITPSPRIQYTLIKVKNESADKWQEFRPRPVYLSPWKMMGSLFWNAKWNETMFAIGCAERIAVNPSEHSENEILSRITNDLKRHPSLIHPLDATHLQFRLVFVERLGSELVEEIVFHSRVMKLPIRDKI